MRKSGLLISSVIDIYKILNFIDSCKYRATPPPPIRSSFSVLETTRSALMSVKLGKEKRVEL